MPEDKTILADSSLIGLPVVIKCRGSWGGKEGTLFKWDGGDFAIVELKDIDMGYCDKKAVVVRLRLASRAVYLKATNKYLGQEEITEAPKPSTPSGSAPSTPAPASPP